MKLLNLKIQSRFRSLQEGFTVSFHKLTDTTMDEFHPFCFAGLNGSGKSNVLEVLSSIFYHLECCAVKFLPKEFRTRFKKENCDPAAFEIEYLIVPKPATQRTKNYKIGDLVKVKIIKNAGEVPKMSVIEDWQNEINENSFSEIDLPAKRYLPDLIIGYSSGENEILSLPFFKTRFIHYDEYSEYTANNYKNYKEPESGLVYVDYSLSQAVLLANFLMQKEDVLTPIKKQLEIADVREFRLVFYHRNINGKPILELMSKTIDKLKRCATSWYYDRQKGITYIDYLVTPHIKEAFRSNFNNNPFELFRAFQILLTLNLYYVEENAKGLKSTIYTSDSLYIEEKLLQPTTEDHVFYFNNFYIKSHKSEKPILLKSLSDGEHQFLHTMGICLMLSGRSSLLLLDEPETHFNPDWRSKFIFTLKECLNAAKANNLMQEILVTSHSPFIISDCRKEKVKWFNKTSAVTQIIPLDFETYGASVDYIHKRLFNNSLIPKGAFSELEKLISTGTLDELRRGIEEFGESSQKQFLFRKIFEKTNPKK